MAFTCDVCSKNKMVGNKISHSNIKTKKTQEPNLQRVRAMIDGAPRRIRVCTRCLRSGKVIKAA
ncbi:MAG: 50S ribosomal protein L28 [Deltaproteobacteria bacterium]|nr:50S ribosomal protein L28 [Deltaproteobacteria bacterium]